MQPCYIYNISIFLDFGKLFYLLYYCPPRGAIKAPLDLTDRSLSQRLLPSQRAKPRNLRLLRNFKVTCTFDFVFNRSQDSEFCAAVSDLTYNSCFPPFHLCKCVRLNTRFTETGLVVTTVAFTQMKRRGCRNLVGATKFSLPTLILYHDMNFVQLKRLTLLLPPCGGQ